MTLRLLAIVGLQVLTVAAFADSGVGSGSNPTPITMLPQHSENLRSEGSVPADVQKISCTCAVNAEKYGHEASLYRQVSFKDGTESSVFIKSFKSLGTSDCDGMVESQFCNYDAGLTPIAAPTPASAVAAPAVAEAVVSVAATPAPVVAATPEPYKVKQIYCSCVRDMSRYNQYGGLWRHTVYNNGEDQAEFVRSYHSFFGETNCGGMTDTKFCNYPF